jgi:hypothetical protein
MTMTQAVPQVQTPGHLPPSCAQVAGYADRLSERATAPIKRIAIAMMPSTQPRAVYCIADRIDGAWVWLNYVADWGIPAPLQSHESPEAEAIYNAIKGQRKALDRGDALMFWQGVAAPTKHPKAQWLK